MIAAADDAGVNAFGSFSTGTESTAVANSKGIRVGGTRTSAQLLTVSMGPNGGTGYAEQAGVDATTIDAAAVGREAAEKARATANAVADRAGDWTRSSSRSTRSSTCSTCSVTSASAALAVQEERSFVEPGKRDRRVSS